MSLLLSHVVNGRIVTSRRGAGRGGAPAGYPTSSTCRTCGETFPHAARRRGLKYCGGTCKAAAKARVGT